MKKCIYLISFIFLVNSLAAQNISGLTESIAIDCNGGTASWNLETDASTDWSYQIQFFNSGFWGNFGGPVLVTGSSDALVGNLFAGQFRIITLDLGGSPFDTSSDFMVNQPAPLTNINGLFDTIINVTCNGGNDGSIYVFIAGGTLPYSYNWSNIGISASDNIENLTAGNYSVSVTDFLNCPPVTSLINIIEPPLLTATNSILNQNGFGISCNGGNDGEVTVNGFGGVPPYEYSIDAINFQTSNVFPGLITGTYTLTVKDDNDCIDTTVATITEPSLLSATNTTSNFNGFGISCNGGNDGEVTVNGSGGVPSYEYSIDGVNFQTSNVFPGLTQGPYLLVVRDINGCTTQTSVTLSQPSLALSASLIAISDFNGFGVRCNGDSDGTATAQGSGGTPNYTYSWNTNPVQTTAQASSLPEGNFICSITDNNGCLETTSVTITQPLNPLLPTSTPSNFNGSGVSCFGDSNGTATAVAIGGVPNYTYSWNTNPVQNTSQATGLAAGNYTCTITDNNNCFDTTSLTITQPITLSSSLTIVSNFNSWGVRCFDSNDGIVNAIGTGGTPNYSYSWNTNPVQNTAQVSGLESGIYVCTITDINNCTDTNSVTLTAPPLLEVLANNDFLNCKNDSNGISLAIATGGVPNYSYSWNTNPVQNTAQATALIAGNYICTITDLNGCQKQANSTVTEPPSSLVLTMDSTAVSCFNGNDGAAEVSAVGGFPPYDYVWNSNPQQFVAQATALLSGNYSVDVTDANLCTVTKNVFVDSPLPITVPISSTIVSCINGSDGTATANPVGGTSPYTYLWNTLETTQSIDSLSAIIYSLQVFDANNCPSGTATVNIQESSQITATGNVNNVLCHGDSTGVINLGVSGGNSPYTFSWNTLPIQQTQNATNLSFGTYIVTILDSTQCSEEFSYFVNEPAIELSATISPSSVLCFGDSDGSLTVSALGGTPFSGGIYSYLWLASGQTSITLPNLSAGNYTCQINDDNGCLAFATGFINEPNSITLSSSTSAATCYNEPDGSAIVTAQGGIPPYTYNWSNGQTTQQAINLLAGFYDVIVFDANSCSDTITIEIQQPDEIQAVLTKTNILCNGDSSGQITINVTVGAGPFTYSWSNGHNDPINQNLFAGDYDVTVTDIDGCIRVFSETLTQPLVISTTFSYSDISVNGATDGNISSNVSGGVPIYTYSWSGPNNYSNNTSAINALESGLYTLIVTDASGCSQTFYQPINEPDCNVNIDTTYIAPLCFEGMGTVYWQNTNGLFPYSNTLIGPNNDTIIDAEIFDFPNTAQLYPAGVYDLVVTDASGCIGFWNIDIITPDLIEIDYSVTHVLCYDQNNGTVSLEIVGGTSPYNIDWGFSNPNLLTDGAYNVEVSDVNGCSSGVINYVIEEPDELVIDSVITTLISCDPGNDGLATCYASGGSLSYEYLWSNGSISQTAQNLNNGIYSVTVTDNNGCNATYSNIQITNSSPINIIIQETPISCLNGADDGALTAILVSGARPITYSWRDLSNLSIISSDSIVYGLSAGAYELFATDVNGCIYQNFITLSNPTAISFSLIPNDLTSSGSNDGWINVIGVSGGQAPYTYSWSGITNNSTSYSSISTSINNLESGQYTLQITDANGCSFSQSTIVNEPDCDLLISTVYAAPLCFGDMGALIWTNSGASGTYTNIITDGTGTQIYNNSNSSSIQLSVGESYVLVVQDQLDNTCQGIFNITPTSPNPLIAKVSTDSVSCFGDSTGSVIIAPQGGTGPYNIDYGGIDPNALAAGTYSVILTDANNCATIPPYTSFSILQPLELDVTIVSSNVSCFNGNDGSASVNVTGGTSPYTYLWSPSGDFTQTVNNLSADTHYVIVTDDNGCILVGNDIDLLQPDSVLIAGFITDNASCFGNADGSIQIFPSGGTAPYSYLWSNGQTTDEISGLAADTYSCIVTDINGCIDTFVTIVNEPTEIILNLIISNPSCYDSQDGSVTLGITGGSGLFDIVWFNNDTLNSISGLGDGVYYVFVTDNTGCNVEEYPKSFTINEPQVLLLTTSVISPPSCSTSLDASVDVTVSGGTPIYNYTWSDSLNNPITSNSLDSFANNLSSGTYNILVTDANGCNDTASIVISPTAPIIANITTDSTLCHGSNDGSATANPTGGTAPYQYVWSGGTSLPNSATYSGLDASTNYFVTITDDNNCNLSGILVTIPEPDPISINFSLSDYNGFNVTCHDASDAIVTVSVNGGSSPYDLSLNNIFYTANSVFSNISPEWFIIYAQDDNDCQLKDSVLVSSPNPILPNIFVNDSLTCNGADDALIASISPTGGAAPYSYLWSNGEVSSFIDSLPLGSYSLELTDMNNCSGVDTVVLVPIFTLEANPTFSNISCTGSLDGNAVLNPTGGTSPYTFSWDNGMTTDSIFGLASGQYLCTISDDNGCEIIDTINIIESPTSLTISDITVTNVNCNGDNTGTAYVVASGGSGGYTYLWTDMNMNTQNTQMANALYAGTVILEVTDLALCTVYDTVIINEPLAALSASINSTDISCFGLVDGNLTVSFMGGVEPYEYNWFGPNSYTSNDDSIINLIQGEYVISVIDSNDCITNDTSYISQPAVLDAVYDNNNPACYGDSNGSISLFFSGGVQPYSATYSSFTAFYPTNDSAIISNIPAGSDTLYVFDGNGCETKYFVNLISPLELIIDNIAVTNTTCFNSPDGSLIANIIGGTPPYSYQLIDENNLIVATSNIALGLIDGSYTFQVYDDNGCFKQEIRNLSGPDEIEIIQEVSCYGSILVDVVNAIGTYDIFWEGDIPDSSYIDGLNIGEYQVTVIDELGCVKVDSFIVNDIFDYTTTDASCLSINDGSINIDNINEGIPPFLIYINSELSNEVWNGNRIDIDTLISDTYILTLIDANDCILSDTFFIDFVGGYNCIDIPIIITPNSDGINDVWHPIYDLNTEIEVTILNRWGGTEFYYEGNSVVFEWDGLNSSGNRLPSTDYYYIIKFRDIKYLDRTGVITLMR